MEFLTLAEFQWLSPQLALVVLLGFIAGLLGGMLGVGGSVLMIPGLVMIYGHTETTGQHLYQAAAMIVNVAVSIPATLRHRKAGTVQKAVVRWMLPVALVAVFVGVWMSNWPIFKGTDGGIWLGRILGLFLFYVVIDNIRRLLQPKAVHDASEDPERMKITPPRCGIVGTIMGVASGLLGIGGGGIGVPLQQVILKLPLRNCIANSSTIICVIATFGAIYKNASLAQHGYDWKVSLIVAAMLAPTAWVGGRLGAVLTHRLPLRQVRMAFVGLMLVGAWKMAHLPWP